MSTLAPSIFLCNSQAVSSSQCVAKRTSELCPRFGYYYGSRSFSLYDCVLLKCGYAVGFKCVASAERNDSFYMKRCVEIAKKAQGYTSPNPMVGCVIVKGGEIVGEGFHPKAGEPHAEVYALRDAGDLAENATAYVSLEPCNHYGRTPPCTEALIRAKVKKVVVGMVDPNPIVASKGVERLRECGVEVKVGVEEELCRKLNEAYIHKMLTSRPFVALRYSLLISGKMSNQLGEGAEEPGGYYSKLMQEYDGVIISGAYFAKYNLPLKSKEIGAKPPVQIIVASFSNAPLCLPVMTTESGAIVFKGRDAIIDQATEKNLHEMDIDIVVLECMDLGLILDHCGKRGLCNVLVDFRGGCNDFVKVIREGLKEGLCQKLIIELLLVFEGTEGSSVVGVDDLAETRLSLRDLQTKVSNKSVVVDGYIF